MKLIETKLADAHIIELEPIRDDRGFFARAFSAKDLEAAGLKAVVAQTNMSHNVHKGTVRGMHYQVAPSPEVKIVRCIRGAIVDIIVDIRPDSPTYLQNIAVELSSENRRALYVPEFFAHGFQTLTDDTEIMYMVSEYYAPACEAGLRWDDPELKLEWPLPMTVLSPKDAAWPLISSGVPIHTPRRGLAPLVTSP